MKIRQVGLLGMLILLLAGCGRGPDLVIWADPWLEDLTNGLVEQYQSEFPDHHVEVVFRSTEVIAQNLRYGQPMDLVLGLDSRIFTEIGVGGELEQTIPLASDRVVKVNCLKKENQERFQTSNCTVISASDRPLRRFLEDWQGPVSRDSCHLVGDFPAQVRDYLGRGWAKNGFIFESAALNLGNSVAIISRGPLLEACVSGSIVRNAPHPQHAATFAEFFRAEKTRKLLVRYNFITYF
ncbi:MAG: hypothetical protein H6581_13195 [Bacteroidia bacterium]|nr:hypothetical protein [Bacteroidia bacterium]